MDIKEFIKEAISQIANGTKEVNMELSELGACIPDGREFIARYRKEPIEIDFDIAVTAIESEGTKANAGIKVASVINFGGGIDSKTESQIVSRVKFKLPLLLPNN